MDMEAGGVAAPLLEQAWQPRLRRAAGASSNRRRGGWAPINTIARRALRMNQLSSLVVTAPEPLRNRLATLSKQQLARKSRPTSLALGSGRRRAAANRSAGRVPVQGDRRDRLQPLRTGGRDRTTTARRMRRRGGLRGAARCLQRRSTQDGDRGVLHRVGRHDAGRRVQRQAAPPPPQPRR
jgi:hypothetical protein